MSRMKPMSSIRSASSRTRTSTPRQVDRALVDEVEQAAGRRDDDLGAGAELRDLGTEADAAVHGRGADRPVACRRCGRSPRPGSRARASARRRGHARGWPLLAAVAAGRVEVLDDRQHERRRLAGAGLGAGEHVAAVEDERGSPPPGPGWGSSYPWSDDGAEQLGRQPETVEGHAERRLLTGPMPAGRAPVRAMCGGRDQAAELTAGADRERPSSTNVTRPSYPIEAGFRPKRPRAAGRTDWTQAAFGRMLGTHRRLPGRPASTRVPPCSVHPRRASSRRSSSACSRSCSAAMGSRTPSGVTSRTQEPDADEVDLVASFGPLDYKSTSNAFRGGSVHDLVRRRRRRPAPGDPRPDGRDDRGQRAVRRRQPRSSPRSGTSRPRSPGSAAPATAARSGDRSPERAHAARRGHRAVRRLGRSPPSLPTRPATRSSAPV